MGRIKTGIGVTNGKSKNGKLKICMIGSGVVGTATGKGFAHYGHDVCFADIDQNRVNQLNHEGLKAYTIKELSQNGYLPHINFLTVSTPTRDGSVVLDYLKSAVYDLGLRLKKSKDYQLVVVKSTVPPGTTQNLITPILEETSGKKAGRDFGVAMNPEYLREESAFEDFIDSWLVVIGQMDGQSGDLLELAYQGFNCPIIRTSLVEAEVQKYVHNLFNAAKISFFNELRPIIKDLGGNTQKIFELVAASAEGMWNPQYGIRDFGAYSGACLPKDTQGFYAWATRQGYSMDLLKAVIDVNSQVKRRQQEDTNQHDSRREWGVS